MTSAMQPHPDDGLAPAFTSPRNACDAHFHIFGPADKYPHATSDLRYQPPYAPLDQFLTQARGLGFARFVFVQPSAYGLDNACMLDAMAQVDPAVRRGIVHLDETNAKTASEVAASIAPDLHVYVDHDGSIPKAYKIHHMPQTFVIDREGRMLAWSIGLPGRPR